MKRNSSFRDRLASADPDESSGAQPAPQASQKLSTKQDMRSNVALREGWMHKLPVRDKHAISGFRRRYLRLMPPDQLEWWVEEPTPTADPKGILDVTEKTTVQVREIAKSDCAKGGGSQKEATIQTGDLKLVIRAAPPPGKPSNDEEEQDEVGVWVTVIQTQISQLQALRTTDRGSSMSNEVAALQIR
jgi:hypothetical protein